MKPAGVFDVKYRPRQRDMFTDWIQAGETFYLSEQLRALIARDCYPRFQGTNSFRLDDIKNWLRTYLTVHGSSLAYYNNRYKNSLHSRNSYSPKLLIARSLYLLTNHELGHVLQTSAVYILELPAYLNRHMMPNTPPPSPFLLHPNREDHMVVTPRVQDEPVPKKKTVILLTPRILGSSGETVRCVTHTHTHIMFICISIRCVAGRWLMRRALEPSKPLPGEVFFLLVLCSY